MPYVVSKKLLAANAANAATSTGPRTAEGKARCAQNAVTHGLFAKDVVIPGEQPLETQADFDALHEGLRRAVNPRDELEESLVLRVATANWRTRRALRFEAASIRLALDAATAAPPPDPRLTNLDRYIEKARYDAQLNRTFLARAKTNPPPDDEYSCHAREVALTHACRCREIPDATMRHPQNLPQLIAILEEEVQTHEQTARDLQAQHDALAAEIAEQRAAKPVGRWCENPFSHLLLWESLPTIPRPMN